MQAVKYARPGTVEETVRLLREHGPTARVLAGGTDVIVQARERRAVIDLFVDIKHLPEVIGVRWDAARGLSVGAATPFYQLYAHPDVRAHYPALVDSAALVGGTAIQGRASLGGNLCNASPAADTIPSMIVLGGRAVIAGPGGIREVPVAEFCTGPGTSVLQPGEFVLRLLFPPPPAAAGAAFERFIPRNEMDIAVVNAAAFLRFDGDRVAEARVAIGAVAPTPLGVPAAAQALAGKPLSEESIAAAAAAARDAARPINDMRGSIPQRQHLAGVLTARVVRRAAARARGG